MLSQSPVYGFAASARLFIPLWLRVAAGSLPAFAAKPVKIMDAKMGEVMTTPNGMTLYTFDKDTKDKSNCDVKCLKNWPAFHADADAKASAEGE
jgi:predicted lipoprotein with Yx(FWY)xxD motif